MTDWVMVMPEVFEAADEYKCQLPSHTDLTGDYCQKFLP